MLSYVAELFQSTLTCKKSSRSTSPCNDSVEEVELAIKQANSKEQDSTLECIDCTTTSEECPADPPCQELIDELYAKCDGVSLPNGFQSSCTFLHQHIRLTFCHGLRRLKFSHFPV